MKQSVIIGSTTFGDALSEYFIKGYQIDRNATVPIELADAEELLTTNRFDLICKLHYIDCLERGTGLEYATELYTEHIRAFSNGTFTECGNEDKNSIEKYISVFRELIADIKKHGFDFRKSVVPVGSTGILLNGSHRAAIAIYYHIPLPIIRVPFAGWHWDYAFFKKRGLPESYLDFMALTYLCHANDGHVVCLWPRACATQGQLEKTEELLREVSSILYKKSIRVNLNGMKQLMLHAYGKESWIGSIENGFRGAVHYAERCYAPEENLTFYVLAGGKSDKLAETKDKIRDIFQLGHLSTHITDTKEEALLLGKELLNANSVDLLNFGNPLRYPTFLQKLSVFRETLETHNCNFDDYLVESGAVLALYGLRNTSDIDYLTLSENDVLPESPLYENHSGYGYSYAYPLEELFYRPENHLFYQGVKFLALRQVKEMKERRGEEKDRNDVTLLSMKEHNIAIGKS